MRTWSCSAEFELTAGEFNREALSHLTKKQIRRLPQEGHFVFSKRIEADGDESAVLAFRGELRQLLGRYDVGFDVYAIQVVEVK